MIIIIKIQNSLQINRNNIIINLKIVIMINMIKIINSQNFKLI